MLRMNHPELIKLVKAGRVHSFPGPKNQPLYASAEIHALYDELNSQGELSPQRTLEERVARLEEMIVDLQADTLPVKRGKARDLETLRLMRMQAIAMQGQKTWSMQEIAEIANAIHQVQEAEILMLADACGPAAWVPITNLLDLLIHFVETEAAFTEVNVAATHKRLVQTKERFYGLVAMVSRVPARVPAIKASQVLKEIQVEPSLVQQYLAHYADMAIESKRYYT